MQQKIRFSIVSDIWKLSRGFWRSEEKWMALLLLFVIIGLQFVNVSVSVLMNEWNNTFYTAMQNYDSNGFFNSLRYYAVLFAGVLVIGVYQQYLQQLLELKWRRWMTDNFLGKWMKKGNYYLMQVADKNTDNPDQRISEDLKLFINSTLDMSIGLLNAVVTMVTFIPILWRLSGDLSFPLGEGTVVIPGYLVWVAILYSAGGTWITAKLGNPLVGLNFNQQRYEADFRYSMVRLRENSESIAFYGGEAWEEANFRQRFKRVFDNYRQVMLRNKKLSWFTSGYGQIQLIFPLLVISPRFFSGQIGMGGLMQTRSAFMQVESPMSFFIGLYSSLTELQAAVNRLTGFIENMDRMESLAENKKIKVTYTANGDFVVNGLEVRLPDGAVLLQDLELTLDAGDTLLITGDSGCGKSTLIRTLAGIWPFGEGCVQAPEKKSLLFLPQKSYLPMGTLREVLSYPYAVGSYSDERLREVLSLCKLPGLIDKLAESTDWSQELSLGEQQRIAFVRVLLQQPKWLFLDEATSALDEPTEQHMYNLVGTMLPGTAVISVGHRSTLLDYHKMKLSIEASGRWKLAA